MKIWLLLFVSVFVLTGCGTTTYKAKSNGWDKVIEAKTISIADTLCKDHYGYFKSIQYEQWHDYNHGNYYEYNKVEVICYDGYTESLPIERVFSEVSPRVAELLKPKESDKEASK